MMKKRILEILAEMKDKGESYVSFPAIAYLVSPELEQIEEEIINMGRLDKTLPSILGKDKYFRWVYIDTPKIRQERRKLFARRRAILTRILKILWDLEEEGYLKTVSTDNDFEKDEAELLLGWYITDKIIEEVKE
jgi:hypothetical protein